MNPISFTIKAKTVSEANSSEHHFTKWNRHQTQKRHVRLGFRNFLSENPNIKIILPIKITLVRIAPRKLDLHDNLPMSLKYIRDYIADYLIPGLPPGRADDSPELSWSYSQEKGKPKQYAVRIIIEEKNEK